MEEKQQVQAIVDAAQGAANDLSLAGQHLGAARVMALVQLARVLWTRLNPEPETKPELALVEGAGG